MIIRVNQIKPNLTSTLGILHTNLASINKYHDDLSNVLTLLKPEIHIIGISEHKIHKNDTNNATNINLEGYHPFVFDPTETTHGGTGFYIKDSLVFKRRDDLKFNSSSDSHLITYQSGNAKTQIDFILLRKRNLKMAKDIKVIPSEECVPQHKLLICELRLKHRNPIPNHSLQNFVIGG